MADEIHHPHDLMVRAVLSDLAEATSFLQRHLPQEVIQALNWSTLTLREGSFVDEDLGASEADFLYEMVSAAEVLLSHLGPELSGTPGSAGTASDCATGVLPGRAELVVLN